MGDNFLNPKPHINKSSAGSIAQPKKAMSESEVRAEIKRLTEIVEKSNKIIKENAVSNFGNDSIL